MDKGMLISHLISPKVSWGPQGYWCNQVLRDFQKIRALGSKIFHNVDTKIEQAHSQGQPNDVAL